MEGGGGGVRYILLGLGGGVRGEVAITISTIVNFLLLFLALCCLHYWGTHIYRYRVDEIWQSPRLPAREKLLAKN